MLIVVTALTCDDCVASNFFFIFVFAFIPGSWSSCLYDLPEHGRLWLIPVHTYFVCCQYLYIFITIYILIRVIVCLTVRILLFLLTLWQHSHCQWVCLHMGWVCVFGNNCAFNTEALLLRGLWTRRRWWELLRIRDIVVVVVVLVYSCWNGNFCGSITVKLLLSVLYTLTNTHTYFRREYQLNCEPFQIKHWFRLFVFS